MPRAAAARRVALVAPRYGTDFVGGAERSFRTIAEHLTAAGHSVEVFSTCNRHDSVWANELAPGTAIVDGIPVHRFTIDSYDREAHLASLDVIRFRKGRVSPADEQRYLAHSLGSSALLSAVARRRHEFDAILVGPYLFGLTWQVASAFPERTVLVPCFHEEPLARLAVFQKAYARVAGAWYHSDTEKRFAETELGLNHPTAAVVGTCLDAAAGRGDAARGRARCGPSYLLYCGRYTAEKGVDELLEFEERYAAEHGERFRFVFVGGGGSVPRAPWILDLGFLPEREKADVIAGAKALVHLSKQESLSLVALEAWAAGVPVIADRDCPVLREHIERSGGGRLVRGYAEFAATLNDLWINANAWRAAGGAGKSYVEKRFASPEDFQQRLVEALESLRVPLAQQMRRRGLSHAEWFHLSRWEGRFLAILDQTLHEPRREQRLEISVDANVSEKQVAADSGTILVPVTLHNRGTLPAVPTGPARTELECLVRNRAGSIQGPARRSPLPGLVAPEQTAVALVVVPVPARAGQFDVSIDAIGLGAGHDTRPVSATLRLLVTTRTLTPTGGVEESFLRSLQKVLAEAVRFKTLPDDYRDVTQGFFARWKRRIKHKLLNNFRKAYVDVLARQQSAFNEQTLLALAQLSDCCSALGQAVDRTGRDGELRRLLRAVKGVMARERRLRRRCRELERRVTALEIARQPAGLVDSSRGVGSSH